MRVQIIFPFENQKYRSLLTTDMPRINELSFDNNWFNVRLFGIFTAQEIK